MRKKIVSILICTLLIISFILILPGPISIGKTNIESYCCGRSIDCTMLISDSLRIIEINNTEEIVWKYSIGCIDAEKLDNGNILIAGAILVKEVNILGTVVWQYSTGLIGVSDVERLNNDNTLITDSINNYVIEVNHTGAIVWQYDAGVSVPMDAERLSNGNTLIVLNLASSVIEVNSSGSKVWEYSTGLALPTDAERLANGNTLISDYSNNRVIEVNTSGGIVWNKTGLQTPQDAERLSNGNTLIVEHNNNKILEVNSSGNIVWSYSTALFLPNDVELVSNQPPTTPDITGPSNGLPNIPSFYFFASDDPGGHSVFYFIDWGDGDKGWIGPFLPGTPIIRSHTWNTSSKYTIRAKARDVCEVESGWGEKEVTIPRNKEINTPFLNFLEKHTNLFPLLRLLLQKSGLI